MLSHFFTFICVLDLPDINELDNNDTILSIPPNPTTRTDAEPLVTADSQVMNDMDDIDTYYRLVPLALNNRYVVDLKYCMHACVQVSEEDED